MKNDYQSCYECENFSSDDSTLHKLRVRTFCKFIGRHGEEKLLKYLKENEKSGIYYHKNGNHYGDYDNCETEEEILVLIFNNR